LGKLKELTKAVSFPNESPNQFWGAQNPTPLKKFQIKGFPWGKRKIPTPILVKPFSVPSSPNYLGPIKKEAQW